jgi:hypothetical protein
MRSFKLYWNNIVLWTYENLTLSPGQEITFNRSSDHPIDDSQVQSLPGTYTLKLKGGPGTLDDITMNSADVACQSGASCNPVQIVVVDNGGGHGSGDGCTDAPRGKFPNYPIVPDCTGSDIITQGCLTGEYSDVSVNSGTTYTFSSSVGSDFITITNYGGTTVLATGTGSVSYTPTSATIIRFYTHTNSNCGTSNTSRSRMVRCGNSTPTAPANDLCANATNLSCGIQTNGTLAGATPTTSVSYATQRNKNDIFYQFTADNDGDYTVTLSDFSGDKDLFLYSGCSSTSALESSESSSSTEAITHACAAGTTYRIRIIDFDGKGGTFSIKADCPTASQGGCLSGNQ